MTKATYFFGDWQDNELELGPTPIGTSCTTCKESIAEGDAGQVTADRTIHRECFMLTVMGCMYGICRCTNYGGLSTRQAGIEVVRRIMFGDKRGST